MIRTFDTAVVTLPTGESFTVTNVYISSRLEYRDHVEYETGRYFRAVIPLPSSPENTGTQDLTPRTPMLYLG